MQKKFLSMVTALVMLISLLPQGILTVSAATITATQPSTDENGVYQIGTAAELYWFAAQVNGGTTDINAVLTANITVNTGVLTDEGYLNSSNMDNFTSWTPIGNSSKQYTGTFNGNGKTISGLYFNNTSTSDTNAYYVGLFGYVGSGGRVSSVGVVDSCFEGADYIGGVCGVNYGTIENCYNAGLLTSPNNAYIGGVCGANYDTIKNCYNAGIVLLSGVCGYNSSSGIIENCYNAGTVRKRGSAYGVCRDNRSTIKNCYYLDTTGTDSYATPKTAEEFASGEVAYLLQSGQKADENGNIPEVWGQKIGTDNYPVQGGAKVYQVIAYAGCEKNPGNGSTVYSNTDAPVYGDHSFDSNGFCEYGDSGYQPAEWDETNNRYEISNAGQLYWFAGLVNGTLSGVTQNTSANAILTANIDLSGTGNWTPIGNDDNKYSNDDNKYRGTFDGQSHTVKDMSITKQGNNSGLFGYTDGATIKNIIITGEITITAESYTEGYGSIVGRADNNTAVTNCHSSVNITIDSTMESTAGNCIGHIGGIVGKMHGANPPISPISPISNCSYSGTIELKDKPINVAAGIVGYAIFSSVPITNCSFTGKINSTNTGATIIGGIFGYTRSKGDVKVTNCLSVGTITKSGDTSVTGILIGQINTGYGNNAVKNNYCISSSLNVIGSITGAPTTAPATLCTETQLTSGEVAYLLNGSTSEGTLVWGQDLSTADSYPVITSDLAKKVLKVEFKTLGDDGEYTLYTEKYGNYGKVLSDFPEEIRDTIWVDGVNQFTASSTVTEDKTVYSVGYSVKYDDDGKVVISAPKKGNYTIIIASYSGKSLLKVQFADITLESWVDLYEITDLNGFDTTGADTVKVLFWDTEMRPQCDIAVK